MDWDDDDEATHVFDKEKESQSNQQAAAPSGPESRRPEHASMDDILSAPPRPAIPAAGTPPPPPAHTTTLSGAFGMLGQPRTDVPATNGVNGAASPPSSQFRSGPPPSQSLRSAPPPPPGSIRPHNPSTSTAPMPPPPPPGQTTTAPMHMPPRPVSQPPMAQGPGSLPPQQHISSPPAAQHHSGPPQGHVSQPPMPQMPPVNRAMEATSIVPRHQPTSSNAGLWVALLLAVVAAVGVAVFFLMPRNGTLVVNVADSKGGAVSKLEVTVDGKTACTSAPCIVRDVSVGVHEVKVSATGYDTPAARAITVESRKDSSTDFSLSASHAAGGTGGTGIKVAGNPLQTGVHLSVDGKEYGPLPQEIHDVTAGTHQVKITGSERYAAFEKSVDVKDGELSDLGTVALKVLKGKATIQLATPGAKVYLVNGSNRKEVPQFPIAIDFDPNEKWNLEAKLFGMDDYSQPISFDDGQAEKTIVVTLSPKGSTPAVAHNPPPVTAPPGPALATPPTPAAPKQPAAAPAEPKEPVAAKDPPAKKDPPAAAAGGDCFLNINSRPASTVLLDGKPLGPTPRVKVAVTPGTHTVLFVNAEESLKKSVSVTIAAGETKAVSAKLRD
jgi:serine/threonine-protein kinase